MYCMLGNFLEYSTYTFHIHANLTTLKLFIAKKFSFANRILTLFVYDDKLYPVCINSAPKHLYYWQLSQNIEIEKA